MRLFYRPPSAISAGASSDTRPRLRAESRFQSTVFTDPQADLSLTCVVQSINDEVVHTSVVENVKDTIISTIRGTGEIVNAVTETVSGSLTTALKGTGSVGKALTEAASDVASGVIQGTSQVGGDLGKATKRAVMGS